MYVIYGDKRICQTSTSPSTHTHTHSEHKDSSAISSWGCLTHVTDSRWVKTIKENYKTKVFMYT